MAVKFEVALMRFRMLRGYSTEARNNVRAALVLPGIQEPNFFRAHALYVGGVLATNQSDHAEATRMLTECLAIRRGLENPRETAATLSTLATLHLQQDDVTKAREYEEEAINIFRGLEDRLGEAIGLLNLGEISVRQGDDDNAQQLFEQCLVICRSIEHYELESECERDLGELALRAGNLQAARVRFTRSLKICQDAQDKRGEAIAIWFSGRVDAAGGRSESACRKFAEALPAFQAYGMNSEALDCLDDCAALLHAAGRFDDAVRLQAAAAALREPLGLRSPESVAKQKREVDAARGSLGAERFEAAWSVGKTWTLEQSIRHALESTSGSSVTA